MNGYPSVTGERTTDYVLVEDLNGALQQEADQMEMPVGRFVQHAVARYLWLRKVYADGGRVLVEDERTGLLREVRYQGSVR